MFNFVNLEKSLIMNEDIKPSKKLSKLSGMIKLPKDFDEKKELENYFKIKHKIISTNTNQ